MADKRYSCNICKKTYLSYPALYTHKRNKHNIIPITGKEELFKYNTDKTMNTVKFKYSAIENEKYDFSKLMEKVSNLYNQTLNSFFKNKNCILFSNEFKLEDHEGARILKNIIQSKERKNLIPEKDSSIDEALIIYILNFAKVTQNQKLIEIVIKFSILLREHINIVGWDYLRNFKENGLKIKFEYKGPYTTYNNCENVPDFVNDFISVFIPMDDLFYIEIQELYDLTKNLCNWLFVNDLTNFKVSMNEPFLIGKGDVD